MKKQHYILVNPEHLIRAEKLSKKNRHIYFLLLRNCSNTDGYTCKVWGFPITLLKGQYATNGASIAATIQSSSPETGRRHLRELEKAGLIQLHPVKRAKGKRAKGHTIVTVLGIHGVPFNPKRWKEVAQKDAQNEALFEHLSIDINKNRKNPYNGDSFSPIVDSENTGSLGICSSSGTPLGGVPCSSDDENKKPERKVGFNMNHIVGASNAPRGHSLENPEIDHPPVFDESKFWFNRQEIETQLLEETGLTLKEARSNIVSNPKHYREQKAKCESYERRREELIREQDTNHKLVSKAESIRSDLRVIKGDLTGEYWENLPQDKTEITPAMTEQIRKHNIVGSDIRMDLRIRSYIILTNEDLKNVNMEWVMEPQRFEKIMAAPENTPTNDYSERLRTKRNKEGAESREDSLQNDLGGV